MFTLAVGMFSREKTLHGHASVYRNLPSLPGCRQTNRETALSIGL
jgi:hypothetical protein